MTPSYRDPKNEVVRLQEQIIAVAEQRGYEDDDEVGRELDAEIHVPKYSPPSPPQVRKA